MINECTISGNSVRTDSGGGIYNVGTATITASTISGNSAENPGGGIDNSGTLTLLTSIVAGNSYAGQVQDVWGEFNSLGHNLIGNTAGSSGWIGTDLLDIDPKLGPLLNNGGPTMTMALLSGSPAIDAGSNDLIPPGVQYDQRGPGFERIVNGTVDIGAFEYEFLPEPTMGSQSFGGRKPPRSKQPPTDCDCSRRDATPTCPGWASTSSSSPLARPNR